jgi:hypothetical protein
MKTQKIRYVAHRCPHDDKLIDIGVYDFIIDTIRDDYKIPFYSSSPSVYLSNNMSGSKKANFVDTVLQDL